VRSRSHSAHPRWVTITSFLPRHDHERLLGHALRHVVERVRRRRGSCHAEIIYPYRNISTEEAPHPRALRIRDVWVGEPERDRIRVEEWAAAADTITYEIVTQLTARVPRHHLG
jgi:hypothetical protein